MRQSNKENHINPEEIRSELLLKVQTNQTFQRIWNKPLKRVNVLRGGSRSGKSWSLMQLAFLWLLTGWINKDWHYPKGTFSIVRATFPSLRATMLKDFDNYLHEMEVYHLIDHSKTNYTYRYQGREVAFFSADDSHKLRGRAHDFCIFNEGDAMSFDHFMQVLMRLSGCFFVDCNPSNSESWIKTELEDSRFETHGDVRIDVSTVFDNPFISPEIVKEIQSLKDVDEELYKVYTLGEWAKISGVCIPGWKTAPLPHEYEKRYFALDVGFSDQTALVEIRQIGMSIYVKEHIYKKEVLISEIAEYIREYLPGVQGVCDSASPRTIHELTSIWRIRVKPSPKGKDSILNGIQWVRQHELHCTPESQNIIMESKRYKWKKDPDGNPTNIPIDRYNHLMDAIRYGLTTFSKKKKLRILEMMIGS